MWACTCFGHPNETGIGGEGHRSGQYETDIYWQSMVPATGLRGRYFPLTTTGVGKVASQKIACAATGTKHKTATLLCGNHRSSEYTTLCLWLVYLQITNSKAYKFVKILDIYFISCIPLAVYTLWPWWGVACLDCCHRMEFILVKIIL